MHHRQNPLIRFIFAATIQTARTSTFAYMTILEGESRSDTCSPLIRFIMCPCACLQLELMDPWLRLPTSVVAFESLKKEHLIGSNGIVLVSLWVWPHTLTHSHKSSPAIFQQRAQRNRTQTERFRFFLSWGLILCLNRPGWVLLGVLPWQISHRGDNSTDVRRLRVHHLVYTI